MMVRKLLAFFFVPLILCGLTQHAYAIDEFSALQQTVAQLDQRYSPDSIADDNTASLAIAQSQQTEKALETWYARQQAACYDRFFVNACLKDGKVKRRELILSLHRIAIEGKAFQRKQRVEEHDRELTQRNRTQ